MYVGQSGEFACGSWGLKGDQEVGKNRGFHAFLPLHAGYFIAREGTEGH